MVDQIKLLLGAAKLTVIRLWLLVLAHIIYLGKREKINTQVVSIAPSANENLRHITVRVQLKAVGIDHTAYRFFLSPKTELCLDGLITLSLSAAKQIRVKEKFPQAPIFIKLYGKTYALLKSE